MICGVVSLIVRRIGVVIVSLLRAGIGKRLHDPVRGMKHRARGRFHGIFLDGHAPDELSWCTLERPDAHEEDA